MTLPRSEHLPKWEQANREALVSILNPHARDEIDDRAADEVVELANKLGLQPHPVARWVSRIQARIMRARGWKWDQPRDLVISSMDWVPWGSWKPQGPGWVAPLSSLVIATEFIIVENTSTLEVTDGYRGWRIYLEPWRLRARVPYPLVAVRVRRAIPLSDIAPAEEWKDMARRHYETLNDEGPIDAWRATASALLTWIEEKAR